MSRATFSAMLALLGRSADAPEIAALMRLDLHEDLIDEHRRYIDFPRLGLAVVCSDARHVRAGAILEPAATVVLAVHFDSAGYEGHSAYGDALPQSLCFGDDVSAIVAKMGEPLERGGGGFLKILQKPIPHWMDYRLAGRTLHLQLDPQGRLDLVTVSLRDDDG